MIRPLPLLAVEVQNEQDVVLARQRARQIGALLGFDLQGQTKIGTAASEIVRNAFRYAGGGRVTFHLAYEPHRRLVITVSDKGPGIPDLEAILAGRYVSKTGMGMGLLGTRRIMDRVDISSHVDRGTTVTMTKFLPGKLPPLTTADKLHIAAVLAQGIPGDPLGEVQQQNQELLSLLDELNQRQADLLAVNKELEDTNRGVVALYAELDARADFLRKTTEVKSRFLSNMTHEFRTPLNSIAALSTMLIDRTDGDLSPEQERQVGFILRSARDLETLVNDLLDIAKVDAGKVSVRATTFRVRDLFGALKGMLRPLLSPNAGVILEFIDPDPILELHSDEGKISQILRNFISNALKFTERGTVRVSASRKDGGLITFDVTDTGVGIKPEHLPIIFEEFGQVDTGVPQRFVGTGLGLPLSKRLAVLLGGSVTVRSEIHVGSTFVLTIPIEFEGNVQGELISASGDRASTRYARQAMIIDDDEVSRYLISGLFPKNFEITEITDKDVVATAVATLEPDVVFFNIHLCDGPGSEIIRKLKADAQSRTWKIVAYAAHPLDATRQDACTQADALFMLSHDAKTSMEAMCKILAKIGLITGPHKG